MVKEKVENEAPYDRFKRIATRRTQRILYYLRILGNCSNKGGYQYTSEDVRKIFSAIDDETKRVRSLFENGEKKGKEFKL